MKARARVRVALAAATAAMLLVCTEWPTRFERIDADQLRTLAFVYTNLSDTTVGLCEAAPGDSVQLTAYFAGRPLEGIEWRVSYDVYVSPYGSDTARNQQPLEYQTVPVTKDPTRLSDSTEVVAIKFRIPDDVLAQSSAINDAALGVIGGYLDDAASGAAGVSLPFDFSKEVLLQLVDYYARMDPQVRAQDTLWPLIEEYAPIVAQVLSVPVRFFATANGKYKLQSDFTVRYNRFFRDVPRLYVNRNPRVRYVGLYKVKGPRPAEFRPEDMGDEDTTLRLFMADTTATDPGYMGPNVTTRDTVLIDTGYIYYLGVDSGYFADTVHLDTSVALKFSEGKGTLEMGDSVAPELYYTNWWFQHDAAEVAGVDPNDLTVIFGTSAPIQEFLPPLDGRATRVTVWVRVYDWFLGEWNRPLGSDVVETRLHFTYSEAYLDSVEQD
jgi:hypothetical protein